MVLEYLQRGLLRFYKQDSSVVIISDYMFYGSKQEEIDEWCWQRLGYHPRTGMVLTFKKESDMALFLLRWS